MRTNSQSLNRPSFLGLTSQIGNLGNRFELWKRARGWSSLVLVLQFWTNLNPCLFSQSSKFHLSEGQLKFVMIHYQNGSWGLDEERLEMETHVKRYIPNFLKWLNKNQVVQAQESVLLLGLSDDRIFDYPLLFLTGHYDFSLSDQECKNLKTHLENGGFLWIEDCGGLDEAFALHGKFSEKSRKLMRDLFPEGEFKVLPLDHSLFQIPYKFPQGLPPVVGVNNDQSGDPGKARKLRGAEGFICGDRLLAIYSDADICCEWRHNGRPPSEWGQIPFQMGANIVVYAMTH